MSATPRAGRDVPAAEPQVNLNLFENVAVLYKKGVECAAELQNKALDCAVQQNKQAVVLWEEMMEKLPWAPRVKMFEGYAGTLDRLAEVQKAAILLAVDQARVVVEMVKDRTAAASKTAETMSKFAQQSFKQSVAVQTKVAEAGIAETKAAFENVRERFPVPGSDALAESIWKSLDTVMDAQKEMLETAASRWTQEAETVTA